MEGAIMARASTTDLQTNEIHVQDGKVVLIKEWGTWERKPYVILEIVREEKGFTIDAGTPDDLRRVPHGTLDRILSAIHKSRRSRYRQLLNLREATEESILKIGFSRHKIIFLPE